MKPVARNLGMALVYSETPFMVPALYRRIVESWGLHSLVVFITVRQVCDAHTAWHEAGTGQRCSCLQQPA
jgi:hypothetical protein